MLSKNQMVAVRKVIEKTYIGICDVVEYEKIKNDDKTTGFSEVVILENQPCKISFESVEKAETSSGATGISQSIKLFISPDVEIKAGSKVVATQNGKCIVYKSSGQVALYSSHQEVGLELFEEWA